MEGPPTLNGAGRRRLRTNKGRSAQGPEEGARQGAKEEALGMTVLLASHTSARRLFRQGEEGLSEWREGDPPNPLQCMSKGEHVQLSRGLPWRQQAAEGRWASVTGKGRDFSMKIWTDLCKAGRGRCSSSVRREGEGSSAAATTNRAISF